VKVSCLHWDDANIEHVARHGLSPVDIEDVCFGEHISFRGKQRRYVLYGKTRGGMMIMVVLEQLSRHRQVFRPITATPMTEREKHRYRRRAGD